MAMMALCNSLTGKPATNCKPKLNSQIKPSGLVQALQIAALVHVTATV
jgi:hypothetical protein